MVAFNVTGIAAGGSVGTVIQDAVTGATVHVDANGNEFVAPQAVTPSGRTVGLRSDEGGRETMSHAEAFRGMLVEMRAQTVLLHALGNFTDDLELLRTDAENDIIAAGAEANS